MFSFLDPNPKCSTCNNKLTSEPFFIEMKGPIGTYTIGICDECARLLNVICERIENDEDFEKDYYEEE